ncbi:MAG: hypothetical protein IKA64_06820 [Clostridia bacterium]|nr:hypothetical protein [Clostridia bacterium]
MKNTKRIVSACLSVIMLLSLLLTTVACKKNHEHSYTETVTPPTCIAEGYTTYTCTCGDTYTDNIVAATGHKNNTTVTEYPTSKTEGSKTVTCALCGESQDYTIDALSASLPAVSDMIVSAIGDGSYSISLAEDSSFILIKELDDYSYADGKASYLSVKLAEAVLEIASGYPTGHLTLELGTAHLVLDGTSDPTSSAISEFDAESSLSLYIDGDTVSFEISGFGGDGTEGTLSTDEAIYTVLANALGMTYEDLTATVYAVREAIAIIPTADKIEAALGSISLPALSAEALAVLESLTALYSGEALVATPNADGSTTYELNIAALTELAGILNGKTLAEAVDTLYGEGTASTAIDFVISIPSLTVKEIADYAIALAESFGIDVDRTFTLVEFIVYQATGAKVSIEEELASRYALTLGELIYASTDVEPELSLEDFVTTLEAQLTAMVDEMAKASVNEIINSLISGPEMAPGEMSDALASLAKISEQVSLLFTVSAEGTVSELSVKLGVISVAYDLTKAGFEADLVIDLAAALPEPSLEYTITNSTTTVSIRGTADEYGLSALTLELDTVSAGLKALELDIAYGATGLTLDASTYTKKFIEGTEEQAREFGVSASILPTESDIRFAGEVVSYRDIESVSLGSVILVLSAAEANLEGLLMTLRANVFGAESREIAALEVDFLEGTTVLQGILELYGYEGGTKSTLDTVHFNLYFDGASDPEAGKTVRMSFASKGYVGTLIFTAAETSQLLFLVNENTESFATVLELQLNTNTFIDEESEVTINYATLYSSWYGETVLYMYADKDSLGAKAFEALLRLPVKGEDEAPVWTDLFAFSVSVEENIQVLNMELPIAELYFQQEIAEDGGRSAFIQLTDTIAEISCHISFSNNADSFFFNAAMITNGDNFLSILTLTLDRESGNFLVNVNAPTVTEEEDGGKSWSESPLFHLEAVNGESDLLLFVQLWHDGRELLDAQINIFADEDGLHLLYGVNKLLLGYTAQMNDAIITPDASGGVNGSSTSVPRYERYIFSRGEIIISIKKAETAE